MLFLVLVEDLHLAQFYFPVLYCHTQVLGEDSYLVARVPVTAPSASPDTSRSSTWDRLSSKSAICGTGDSSHLSIDWDAVKSSN